MSRSTKMSVNPNAGAVDPQAMAGHSEKRAALTMGVTYAGVVQAVDSVKQCYVVQLDQLGHTLYNVAWAAGGFLSALLGFKASAILPVGTKVLITYGAPSFIIGCPASDSFDGVNAFNKTSTGIPINRNQLKSASFDPERKSSINMGGHSYPSDIIDGEYDLTNALGTGMQFLLSIMKMQAGDRAKVECHLLNDMVRILSDTFRHFSSFGDFQIYNDGGLNVRWDGTSQEHEAYGALNTTDEKIPLDKEGERGADFTSIDATTATGRWRFSEFIGFLGNFINVFVTDPENAVGQIGTAALRPGKAHLSVGNDGSVLLQSVADIAFERVVRIPVPVEKKRWDDPTGVTKASFKELDTSFLKNWNYGQNYQDNMFQAVFQLREYARWLSTFHSYARFHQYADKGEWHVPAEADLPEPDYRNGETDVAQANPTNQYVDAYACFRIMRDGSIVTMGAYGEGVTMFHGNVHVAASRHLTLEAAGDIRMTAGQNIVIKARRSVEISAVVGSLALKARTALQALCEWGPVWLKSDAQDPTKPDYQAKTKADQPFPEEDPEPIQADYAILLDGSQGRVGVRGARGVLIESIDAPDNPDDFTDTSGSVVLQARAGHIQAVASRAVRIVSQTSWVGISAGRDFVVKARRFMNRVSMFDINSLLTFVGSKLNVNHVSGNIITGQKAIKGPVVGATPVDPLASRPPLRAHTNHILKIDPDGADKPTFSGVDEKENLDALVKSGSAIIPDFPATGTAPTWTFPETNYYIWSGPDANLLYQSLAQQRVALDTDLKSDSYLMITGAQEQLQEAPRTSTVAPWPGVSAHFMCFTAGQALHTPSSVAPSEFTQNPLTSVSVSFTFLKKNT